MSAPEMKTASQSPARRLLAIDDDPVYRRLYAHFGQTLFGHVATSESVRHIPEDVLDAADVVILDLEMPNTDGMHFLTEVLPEKIGRNPDLQVIICSGLDKRVMELARRAGQLVGVKHISALSKPFTAAALRNLLAARAQSAPSQLPSSDLEKATIAELREALLNGHVVPYWQPQVSTDDGRVAGLEILSRWNHPSHGFLLPGHFVKAMESDELGVQFALGILDQALKSLRRWEKKAGFTGRVSLNAPPSALIDPTFAERLMRVLDSHQFPEHRLVLEVTEHAATTNDSQLLAGLARIMMHHVPLSIDDFGTGHSSLDRLGTEAFGEIKIDRAFIAVLGTSSTTAAITRSIIQTAKSEGLRIVAEGVSTAQAVATLRDMGCSELQGSYFAMPLSEDQLVGWFGENQGYFPEAVNQTENNVLL